MEKIINLTEYEATPEQVEAGVIEPEDKGYVQSLLTFYLPPDRREIEVITDRLASVAIEAGVRYALIDGAPYLIPHLERTLWRWGILPLYSFRKEVVEKEVLPNGDIVKTKRDKHIEFVPAIRTNRKVWELASKVNPKICPVCGCRWGCLRRLDRKDFYDE